MSERFDWDMLMRFGLGVVGLGPDEFWKMTPREFQAAVEGRLGRLNEPMGRDGFEALARRFPDQETTS